MGKLNHFKIDTRIFKKESSRLNYIIKFILGDIQGVDYKITQGIDEFKSYNSVKINYSDEKIENSFQIIPADLLFENDIIQKRFL